MARKALAFLLLLGTQAIAAPASAAAGADGFENLDKLEGRLVGALDADVGKPGGPAAHIDRRLKLQPCPTPVTIDPPALGAVALRCEPLGWRIRIPLTHGGHGAPARPSCPWRLPRRPSRWRSSAAIRWSSPPRATASPSPPRRSRRKMAGLAGASAFAPEKGSIIIGEVVDIGRVRVTSF